MYFAYFCIITFQCKIITENSSSPNKSIISQLSAIISQNPSKHRCKEISFSVTFKGKSAINAGRPSREPLTEAASSIFEPTSRICCNVGEFFTPYIRTMDESDRKTLTGIGVFIGIVIHTDFAQDLPF